MTQADRIRCFALDRYVSPARAAGRGEVTVRAGDVHKAMGLQSAMPAVCSALGTESFEQVAGVSLQSREGPAQGANVYFTFKLSGVSKPVAAPPEIRPAVSRPLTPSPATDAAPGVSDTLYLVACVKQKLSSRAPARLLYTSDWFRKARAFVAKRQGRWFILSARHGLLDPETEVEPYDNTLNTMGEAARRAWAGKVLAQLRPHLAGVRHVVFLAGANYRAHLVGPLRDAGITLEVPMQGLAIGEQLSWLSRQT